MAQIKRFFVLIGFSLSGLLTGYAAGAAQAVPYDGDAPEDSIIISNSEHALYYIVGNGTAIRYPVGTPKRGKEWFGNARIVSKHVRPDWSPPEVVAADHPELPALIRGGSKSNPMGSAALMTSKSQVAIHGTSPKMRGSVPGAVSYGCIRMRNEDIEDLFDRVSVGTKIQMVP